MRPHDLARRALLCAAVLPLLAATAIADPGIDRVDWEIQKSRRLLVTVATTVDEKAEVLLEGQINGKPFSFRKRLKKAGARSIKFKIDARKFKLRKLTEEIMFSGITATVREKSGAEIDRAVDDVAIPVPVIVLRGFGNENTPGALNAFAAAFNAGAGGIYTTEGKKPTLAVHEYESLSMPLGKLGKNLGKRVKKLLRGSSFAKVDVVGYSMGGLVARSWIADNKGAGKVRRCVFAGTPNQGAPIAYIGVGLVESDLISGLTGLDGFGLGDLDLSALIESAADESTREAVRVLYPTYTWAYTPGIIGGRIPVPSFLLTAFFGDPTAPLVPLNREAPDPTVEAWHALAYTSIPVEGLGTVDEVTIDASLLSGGDLGDLDLASFAQGDGDGIVPTRSTFMEDVPAWNSVLTTHDMGTGTHVTMMADPAVIARIVELITQ